MAWYNDPEFTLNREYSAPAPAAGAAGLSKFSLFAAAKILAVSAVVKAAGTSPTSGAYLQVLDGTNTIATLLTGSATAGSLIKVTGLSYNTAAGDVLEILQGTDATNAVYAVNIQYNEVVV